MMSFLGVSMRADPGLRGLLFACCLWAFVQPSSGIAADGKSVQTAIQHVLDNQTEAWNRGDLEGFMDGYWKSPDLVFQSNSTVQHGWQATLERYRQRYQSAGKEMGHVDFPDQQIVLLGKDAAVVRGTWHLRFSDGKERQGLYTLILRKLPEGWRIVHDHSSSE